MDSALERLILAAEPKITLDASMTALVTALSGMIRDTVKAARDLETLTGLLKDLADSLDASAPGIVEAVKANTPAGIPPAPTTMTIAGVPVE